MVSFEKIVSTGVFAGLGLGGVAVGVTDTYQDLVVQGEAAATVGLENTVPVALGCVLLWLAWDVYWTSGDEAYLTTVAKMAFVSVIGVAFVALWVVGIQHVQGNFKPVVVFLDALVAVAILGTVAGINEAERDVEHRRFETLFESTTTPVAETRADAEGRLLVVGTNEAFRERFGDVTSARSGVSATAGPESPLPLADAVDFVEDDRLDGVVPRLQHGEPVERDVRVGTHEGGREFRLRLVPVPPTSDPVEAHAVFVPAEGSLTD